MEQDNRDAWWEEFLKQHKLENKVRDLDAYDRKEGNEPKTKKICLEVYSKYDEIKQPLERIKKQLLDEVGKIEQVHLQSGRVKKKISLIEKIIRKRHEYIASQTSDYARLNSENYTDIITDLVGIRLIVNYRGKWQDIHKIVLDQFPLKELNSYENIDHLPHIEYSCAMKSHFRKIGNQMSGSGNHLCEFTRVMFYLDRIPLASICHVQHQCL